MTVFSTHYYFSKSDTIKNIIKPRRIKLHTDEAFTQFLTIEKNSNTNTSDPAISFADLDIEIR